MDSIEVVSLHGHSDRMNRSPKQGHLLPRHSSGHILARGFSSLLLRLLPTLLRHCRNNLFPVFGALVPKHFFIDAFADMPIHQGEFGIDVDGHAVARLVDYLPQVVNQRHKIAVLLYGYAV